MRRPTGPQGKRVPLYPDFILRQALVCIWVFAILLTAAILLPAELCVRALGFLVPFWLSAVTFTWILVSQIRLHDRITSSRLPTPLGKA